MELSPNKTFEAYLARTRIAVDTELGIWLREARWPSEFSEATRHVLEGAGKAVRPALVFSLAEVFRNEDSMSLASLRRLALALEMMHTYSLVHDDLPAMDDDAFRRGRPTLHVLRGEAFAILAGDALLTASFQAVAESFVDAPDKLPRAIAILARAAGASGMIGGQWLDMKSEGGRGAASPSLLEEIHRKKTGALMAASCLLGSLHSLPTKDFLHLEGAINAWGEELGLLFQMVDDLLDARATRAELGKTPGKDAESGKLTYVSLIGIPALELRIRETAVRLQSAVFAPQHPGLSRLVSFVANRGA
jgi:geranylgeranyl pyrophosphate synthase